MLGDDNDTVINHWSVNASDDKPDLSDKNPDASDDKPDASQEKPTSPTPLNPTKALKWRKIKDAPIKLANNKTVLKHVGHLSVHLDPFDPDSPKLRLQVSMLPNWK